MLNVRTLVSLNKASNCPVVKRCVGAYLELSM